MTNIFIRTRLIIWDACLGVDFIFSATLHLLWSALGMTVNPLFYSFQLLNIIWISKTCGHVIASITKNYDQLLYTLLLCLFLIYIFTNAVVQSFPSNFDDDFAAIKCDVLMNCFSDIINQGFRQGGGIGDMMAIQSHEHKQYWSLQAVQLLFFFVINVIFLNIIFGVIIDTFAALREENNERDEDMLNICYVCGSSRTDFSAESKDFDYHLLKQHDLWTYVYFLYYIVRQGSLNLNGLEQYTYDNYLKLETEWLPIANTAYLDKTEDNLIGEIGEDISQIRKWLKKFDAELTKDKKKNNVERPLIGMKKKELHKRVIPYIDENLSQGIITIKKNDRPEKPKAQPLSSKDEVQNYKDDKSLPKLSPIIARKEALQQISPEK